MCRGLRVDTIDRLLGLFNERIQLGAAPDVEPPEPLEEFVEATGKPNVPT
jgi:hypothetical protein